MLPKKSQGTASRGGIVSGTVDWLKKEKQNQKAGKRHKDWLRGVLSEMTVLVSSYPP